MVDYLIKNNPYILECVKISITSYLTQNTESIQAILDFLDELYSGIFEKVKEEGADELLPEKLKRNLQKAASATPHIIKNF